MSTTDTQALTAEQIETAAAAAGLQVALDVAFRRSNGQRLTSPEQRDWDATVQFANSIAALASAQPAPQGWRTIESAPRDDSVLLSDGCTVGEGFWHDGSQCHGHRGGAGWFWESDRGDLLIASNAGATHWMPLPPPPDLPLAGDAPLQGEGK